jgi:hypothetical protein
MRRSLTRIRTSHVGRLPPPKGWADMPARLAGAEITDPVVIAAKVTPAIAETVKKQIEAGIDCIGDGEFWTARNLAHYAAHFTGVEARPVAPDEPPTTRHSTRERDEFPDFYGDCDHADRRRRPAVADTRRAARSSETRVAPLFPMGGDHQHYVGEADDALGPRQVGDDEADPRAKLTRMPFDLRDYPCGITCRDVPDLGKLS